MKLRSVLAAGAAMGALAVPAAAQNTSTEPPVVAVPPPPSRAETPPPPATPAPPPSSPTPSEGDVAAPPAEPVVASPPPPPPPPPPVTIDPDAAYPNGFADPADPFANDLSPVYREEEGGFDWGLLGLLGLLGLIPLFRDRGGRRIVYVERDDDLPPRRTVRRERIDE